MTARNKSKRTAAAPVATPVEVVLSRDTPGSVPGSAVPALEPPANPASPAPSPETPHSGSAILVPSPTALTVPHAVPAVPPGKPTPTPVVTTDAFEQIISLRSYQLPVFRNRQAGILVLHWARQIGKSHTLACWAVDRLLGKLMYEPFWLITVLSNSRDNGAEFVLKCQHVCNKLGLAMSSVDESPDVTYDNMRMEVRITAITEKGEEHIGRIKVLAANPRTARGFSGDLILDEFAFHENSAAIWEAAEPILSSNAEFLCRIASTGNGKHNLFYRIASGLGPNDGTLFLSTAGFQVCRLTRTCAYELGVSIYDQNTRAPITPAAARQKALDKRAYDQNYECQFNDENMCLLTHELIQQAMRGGAVSDEQAWSAATLKRLSESTYPLYLGQDVGRHRDLSVQILGERAGGLIRVLGLLRMSGLRLPDQQQQLARVCQLANFRAGCIDMTGLGLGLVEYSQEMPWGRSRIHGINFSSTEEINDVLRAEGRKVEKARVTENLATACLQRFEDKTIEFHVELDASAIDDLRKPEKIVSPGGRVSIAAVRDEAGHADHFWALALMLRAASQGGAPVAAARSPNPLQPTCGPMGLRRNLFKPGAGI